MKNSNRYKDIFSSKENLTRSDVESYESSSSASKNSVEQKMENDSFEDDAMEGWKELDYDTSSLSIINTKLFPKKKFSWGTATGAMIIGVVSVLLIQNFSSKQKKETPVAKVELRSENSPEKKGINIESADIFLPATIGKMEEVAEIDQINAKEIIDDFASMEDITIELPPLKPIEIEQENTTSSIISNRITGKEIYLHDLKLIDYRNYRTKPVVQTKQLILTGTSADKENEHSETFNSNWENIDVPYMDYLKKSVFYFNKGKNKKALARFETIIESYPKDINANFYGGLCLFNLGEYSKAITYFNNCRESDYNNFDEEAKWITALSFGKMNNSIKARGMFQEIADSKSYYSEQAKEKLK